MNEGMLKKAVNEYTLMDDDKTNTLLSCFHVSGVTSRQELSLAEAPSPRGMFTLT